MGGSWERLVGTIKRALNVVLKERAPKEDTLSTMLAEVEHTVNSRPLVHAPSDARDDEALTLNHFLLGSSSGRITFRRFELKDQCLRKQWTIAQNLANMFWSRWIREYLLALLPRKKWFDRTGPLKVGEVVLIADF